jgi:hypothetical protein
MMVFKEAGLWYFRPVSHRGIDEYRWEVIDVVCVRGARNGDGRGKEFGEPVYISYSPSGVGTMTFDF